MARFFNQIESCIDDLLNHVGTNIHLGIPLGIGKPNIFVNELYNRVKANPGLHLRILTALSLERPKAHNDLEARFLDPFVQRIYGNYPDLIYTQDRKQGLLPDNINVVEFFLKSGDFLHNDYAQQHYLCSNYTHVARDMIIQGVNVLAQAVAVRERDGRYEYSLSCNPDVTLDLIDLLKAENKPIYRILVVNEELPFMENDAIVSADDADAIIHEPCSTHTLFSAPNMTVSVNDYAIGLYVSSLVKDGGTLQIGIGSLGDAIAQALRVRHQHNTDYHNTLKNLNISANDQTSFNKGLYGCSEMFVNGFMALIEAGIIKRQVFNHIGLQHLLNAEKLSYNVNSNTLSCLLEARVIHSPLRTEDFIFLREYGIFKEDSLLHGEHIFLNQHKFSLNLDDAKNLAQINEHLLGKELKGGIYMHGGFFLGPRDFYQKLKALPQEQNRHINMTRIGFINQLYGDQALKQAQRKDALFVNTCMMMTLLGSAVSDGLEDGKLVSGVGGQYNFVAQSQALPDARSILMLRATRRVKGEDVSNIIWQYGHSTIPRHMRDIVITEYGIADLRGQTDADVIKRLLNICDSRFQTELLHIAKNAGKVEYNYDIPEYAMNNLPNTVKEALLPLIEKDLLPSFPFGCDFTEEELAIIKVLQRMQEMAESPIQIIKTFINSLREDKQVPNVLLERLHLDHPDNWRQKLLRQLFIGNV